MTFCDNFGVEGPARWLATNQEIRKMDDHTNIKLGNFIGRECPFP